MTTSLNAVKAGSAAVDPSKFNALVDAVEVLQSGGGGSQPTTHATYSVSGTVVAGELAQLSWAKSSGDDMLDLTDPTEPVVLAEGVYAASATAVVADAPMADPTDKALAYLYLDAEGVGVSTAGYLDVADGGGGANRVSFGMTYFVPAAGTLLVQGVAIYSSVDLTFDVLVSVQRIA